MKGRGLKSQLTQNARVKINLGVYQMRPSNAFANFINNFIKDPETNKIDDKVAIKAAVFNVSKNDLVSVKAELGDLLSGAYSKTEIVDIWKSCHPQYMYGGDKQIEFMQTAYNAVISRLADTTKSYFTEKDAR